MNITEEGNQQAMSMERLNKPFMVKCSSCHRWILNWSSSSECCGSTCEIIAQGEDEIKKLGIDLKSFDQRS